MRQIIFPLACFLFLILLVGSVFAADIAYVYRKDFRIDPNIINIFNELNLTYELVQEDSLPGNFNAYRMIFVGDENYVNSARIPIGDKASIVANSYHGKEWGLVDDAIAQLASTGPLEVRLVGDGIKQVYTKAEYTPGLAVPYNYLKNTTQHNDMAQGLRTVAAAYNGNGDLGTVIAYGDKGGKLWTGHLGDKLCFFGIEDWTNSFPVSSTYWTASAKNLFKECLSFVAVTCNNNSECDDGNDYTEDVCLQTGTVHSNCQHLPIACLDNNDCGTNSYMGSKYCSDNGNDILKDYKTFTCTNPGTSASFCSNSTQALLNQTCDFGCASGTCILGIHDVALTDLKIKNTDDSSANPLLLISGKDYRVYIDVSNLGNFTENVTFSGKVDSLSFTHLKVDNFLPEDSKEKYKTVAFSMPAGNYTLNVTANLAIDNNLANNFVSLNVNVFQVACINDSGCPGKIEGTKYCSGKNVIRNDTLPRCSSPGEIGASCSVFTQTTVVETCADECLAGACIEIVCRQNSDCGTNEFIGNPFCSSKSCLADINHDGIVNNTDLVIWQQNYDPLPVNNNTHEMGDVNNDGRIDSADLAIWQREYGNICGSSTSKNFISFICNNPGTQFSSCSNSTEVKKISTCLDGCANGECLAINCTSDTDCNDNNEGTYDKCVLPGTSRSYCRHDEINCASDLQCGYTGYINQTYCFGNSVWKEFQAAKCIDAGLPTSYCQINITNFELQDCGWGTCQQNTHAYCYYPPIKIACTDDSGCGADFFSANYCLDSDVARDFTDNSCLNQGLPSSTCSMIKTSEVVQDCGTSYSSDFGISYCKNNNIVHNRTTNNLGCQNAACFNSSSFEEVIIQACQDGCVGGECLQLECTQDSQCSDNLFCNGQEKCVANVCVNGNSVDCSSNNLPAVATCNYNPDNNPLTWDFFPGFTSACAETGCTTSIFGITHTLSTQCGVCFQDSDCGDGNAHTLDRCIKPGTSSSYCRHTEMNCLSDLDCGATGVIDSFCFNNKTYNNYQMAKCENAGTLESYCVININPQPVHAGCI